MKNLMRSFLALSFLFAAYAVAKAEEIILQSVQSGMYVTVVNGTLAAATGRADRASRFDTVRLEGNRIAFRDMRNGSFVRAGIGQGTFLASGSPHIRGWETFEVIPMGRGQQVALRSMQNNKYVRAGVGQRSHLAAVSQTAAGWEIFRIVDVRNAQQNVNQNSGPGLNDISGNYRITHVAAQNGFLVQLGRPLAVQSRLSIDRRGNVSATVGCNNISIRISVRDGRVRAEGPGMSSKIRCAGQGQTATEEGITRALKTSRLVVSQGRTVTFKAANGVELMKIQRM